MAQMNREQLAALPGDCLIDSDEVALLLKVAPITVARWRADGRVGLRWRRIGLQKVRYLKADVDAFIENSLGNQGN